MQQKYILLSGNGSASNGGATTAIITGTTGQVTRLVSGVISVTTAATGGGGLVSLKMGTTTIQSWDANSITGYQFNYGENGWPMTTGATLNLVVEGAGANQATAFCMVVAIGAK